MLLFTFYNKENLEKFKAFQSNSPGLALWAGIVGLGGGLHLNFRKYGYVHGIVCICTGLPVDIIVLVFRIS